MRFPIHIELHRSRFLFLLLLVVHALAVGCVAVLPWSAPLRLLLLLLIGVLAWRAFRPPSISALRLLEKGALECVLSNGERMPASVLPDSTVFARLIVLRLRVGERGRVRALTLLPDSMTPAEFRALRVCLRWRAEQPV